MSARGDYNVRYDPRGEACRHALDFGDIGETTEGVWVARHPEAILLDEYPDLLPVFDAFRAGQTDLTAWDWDNLSAPEYDAKFILADCYGRNVPRAWEGLK